ncbi:hypothetical protein ACHAXR_004967 [Thalassiosira sp. AJA248-18]
MTATIVGGGVLSIPLSCALAGILPFTLLMAVSAAATDLSLYLLVSCSRRCGSRTFGGVARSAYGSSLELFTTCVVFFIVGCIIIGLMILNKGIWSPIAVVGMAYLYQEEAGEEDGSTTTFQDAIVLLLLLILMMPFLLKRDLTSLRHTCYIGFFSIAILCIAMAYRALEKNLRAEPGTFSTNVKWMATNIADVLNALPIILLAFLCSFNIISVSCSLVNPTRDRVKTVIHESVFLSFFLMYVFGLAGYLFAYDDTDGNILLCFDPKDPVIFLGRIVNKSMKKSQTMDGDEENGLEKHVRTYGTSTGTTKGRQGISHKPLGPKKTIASREEDFIHWAATLGIIIVSYIIAVLTPGVAIVWDVAGSSMAFMIQFIIPSACYIKLKLCSRRSISRHLVLAWVLMLFASMMAILCTTQMALRLSGKL